MKVKNKKSLIVILITVFITSIAVATPLEKGSWGDKNSEGIRESFETELYNPARYAFDNDEQTFWTAQTGEEFIWTEKYWNNDEDISGVVVNADLLERSKISFWYENEGIWIPFENGTIEGPLNGNTELFFTDSQRKTKKLLVKFNCKEPGIDKIYEITLNQKQNTRTWGKIIPESYSFNQNEYINLKPSRLWDGYIKETWFEPLWYVPYEIQQSKEYKNGIFAPYNGNPNKSGEIIWELDGSYRVDFIKAYFDAGWRSIAFEFWNGKKWISKKVFQKSNKTGWNRLEVNNDWETERIRITFPDGWENARFINQIEIWGEGERKNEVRNILFTENSEENEYSATFENTTGHTEVELITNGNSNDPIYLYVNGNEYVLNNTEFKTDYENIYRVIIKEEDKRNGFQYLKIKTVNNKLKNILVKDNLRENGRIITTNQYSDSYKAYREGADEKAYVKKIILDRKYEIEKVIIYTHNGEGLRISGNKKYGNYTYNGLTNERYGVWTANLKGKECNELNVFSDCEFEIDEAEIFGSPLEDKECAVEIWSNEKNVDRNSCIVGWKGSRESQTVIDGNIYPRQEGNLFWIPVKEISNNYLGVEKHIIKCNENDIVGEKKYFVNPLDDTDVLLNEIKNTTLLLSIDIPYGKIFTQSEEIEISGRYGNGDNISVYVNGEKVETKNGTYRKQILLEEGENIIFVSAKDITERIAEESVTIVRDSIKPVIEIISPVQGEYINTGKAEFKVDGKEDDELWWQFNEEYWERGYGKIKYKDYYLEDGFYTYTVRAQDRSGNISEVKSVNFCMDATLPDPFEIKMNVSGWTNNNQPQAVFKTNDDTSGLDFYEYKIDEGLWRRCESPLNLEKLSDGVHRLFIRAIDNAGNIREENTDLYIDTSIPPEPLNARSVSSDTSILLKWNGLNDNSIVNEKLVSQEGNRNYKIERNPQWKTGDKLLNDYGYGELYFEDTEVEVGKSYAYRICAIDRAGNESEKTEWKSAITGLAVSEISEDGDTVIEYDGMTVTIPKNAVAKDIVKIQINKITDDFLEEEPLNPVVGSSYMITAVRQKDGELYLTNHADLNIPAVIEVSYKTSLIPENYLNSEIAPFYYDDIWGCWLRMPESYINTENNTVLFRTEHFTEFNIQATKKAVLSEAELREGAYKLSGGKIGPSDIRVSGEDGGVSYEFTEYIIPGKGDLSLPVQRVYTTSKALADASDEKESKEITKIDGESVWNIADGWKINMPYMKVNSDNIVIYGTDGQCFTSGQMKRVSEEKEKINNITSYSIIMENHEYTDTIVQLFFEKKIKWNPIITMLTLSVLGDYPVYTFKGAIMHQGDGKKIHFDSKGRVIDIKDCTENQKIHFDYIDNKITITDSLNNEISFVRNNGRITKILAANNSIEYNINNHELKSATDIGKREWNYSYKEETLESKSELQKSSPGYTQSSPKKFKVKTLTEVSGNGYGNTKIEYEVKNDFVYTDTITSNNESYTYEITQGKLYAKKKTEALTGDDILRTTNYTIEYAGPNNKQFYVIKSVADDGNVKTVTNYSTILKERNRLSNAPEAIKNTWNEEETGEQKKDSKQLVTYACIIETYTDTPVQKVTNDINESLMRMKKVITEKAKKNLTTDLYEYDTTNGNVIKESHEYMTGGKTSGVTIEREYCESVNNRTNLVSKMNKKSFVYINDIEKSNITEETYSYNKYGQMISKTIDGNTWNYSYYEQVTDEPGIKGLFKSETSPEGRVSEYIYDYSDSDEYKVTVTRKSNKNNENDSITENKEYFKNTGNLKNETDGDENVTEYEYDILGRMTSQKKNHENSNISVVYDDKNLTTTVTDELGCITINSFDNLMRLTSVKKIGNEQTKTILLEYDNYDRVIKMSEPFYEKDVTDINKTAFTEYEYDCLGRITKLTDSDKHITDYTYTDSENITDINKAGLEKSKVYKDNLGNVIKQNNWIKENEWINSEAWYDGEGKIVKSKDENGNETFTSYNNLGNVETITYPDGLIETKSYDKDGILNGITRTGKNKILSKEEYVLDTFGRIKEKKIFVTPDNKDSKKVVESYIYNKRGLVTEETVSYENDTSDIRTIKKEYDWAGNVIKQTDGEGKTTVYEYDAKGNLIKLTDPREMNTEYSGEFFMQMEYDKFGRVIKGWIPHETKRNNFSTETYTPDVIIEYDAQGNVLKRTDNASDVENALITSYEYSLAGLLKEERVGNLVTKYNYDNAGRLIKTKNQNGIVSNRVYDGSGRLVKEYFEGENNSLSYEYYSNGTIKSKKDRNGNETSYEYDFMNRVIKENTADLILKTYEWNGLGQKTSENDKENNLRSYEYDGLGRLIKETINTEPKTILYYDYDARGNVTMFTDAAGIIFKRKYTDTDLLSEEKVYIKENGVDNPKTSRSYFYDEAGILKSVTEGSNKVYYNNADSKYQPDAYGNIRSMKWEIGTDIIEMKYDYDLLGRTTGVTTPDGKTITYSYDKNGLLTVVNGFVKGNIKYEEGKSRIEYYTLENGLKKSFSYNSIGNISSIEYSAGDNKTGFSYVYDNNFNITSRTSLDNNKTSSFTYDKADRLSRSEMHGAFATQENLDNGKLSQIDCDLSGSKDAVIYFEELPQEIKLDASARSFIYNFKQNISVNRIELFPDTYIHRVRERDILIYYKENENSDWLEINNWKFTKNEQNGSLHFVFIEAVSASMIKVRCIWDDRNFQNESIDTKATFKGQPKNLLRIWTLEESRTEAYEYDYNSNRKSLSENDNDYKYLYYTNAKGGNTARVMYDGKWWYTYDDNGNRTSRALNAIQNNNNVTIDVNKEYWTYTWDFWNRLTEVRQYNAPDNKENVHVVYTYDVLNHRIERISKTKGAEEKTQYGYGRNGAIAYKKKIVGNSVTTRSYAYLNNQIMGFADKQGNTEIKYYTVTDIQGSVTEVYDKDKKLVWKSGYTAFGIKAGELTGLIDFDGLYTGCDYDVETGLTYHWNRWRSEDGSFWLSEDPARDGANWYGYAGCNPINWQDTAGLEAEAANENQEPTNTVTTNGNLLAFANNNLVHYIDLHESVAGYFIDEQGAGGFGHSGMFVTGKDGKFYVFEVIGVGEKSNNKIPIDKEKGSTIFDAIGLKTTILSNITNNNFPSPELSEKIGKPGQSACLMRIFDTSKDMEAGLIKLGFDNCIIFNTTQEQNAVILQSALSKGSDFKNYNLLSNNCGGWARDVLCSNGSGIKKFNPNIYINHIGSYSIPKVIGANLLLGNPDSSYIEFGKR